MSWLGEWTPWSAGGWTVPWAGSAGPAAGVSRPSSHSRAGICYISLQWSRPGIRTWKDFCHWLKMFLYILLRICYHITATTLSRQMVEVKFIVMSWLCSQKINEVLPSKFQHRSSSTLAPVRALHDAGWSTRSAQGVWVSHVFHQQYGRATEARASLRQETGPLPRLHHLSWRLPLTTLRSPPLRVRRRSLRPTLGRTRALSSK